MGHTLFELERPEETEETIFEFSNGDPVPSFLFGCKLWHRSQPPLSEVRGRFVLN